jgi:MscS family membrane protein
LENFATRQKILAPSTLRLKYGTTAEQLRLVLDGIHKLLLDTRKVETETARIRLVNFGVNAIELELCAYLLTADNMEFLAIRENVLLQIAAIVESAGTHFATPTEFILNQQELRPEGGR